MDQTAVSANLERLMGRAILDEAFREQLFTDPEAAIGAAGLSLSELEMSRLRAAITRIKTDQSTEHKFDGAYPTTAVGW